MDVIDLGSGSGILSIAALRLGAKTAVGVDIDPKAEDIARENAAYNDFGADRFDAVTGNATEDLELMARLSGRHYDLVFVNIVADVIIGLAPVLKHFMDENTRVICTGILDVREAEVHELMARRSGRHYDLVFVNIVADVIIGLAPVLQNFMDENTRVICSGILDVREQDVHEALTAAGLVIEAPRAKEDWRRLVARRGDAV